MIQETQDQVRGAIRATPAASDSVDLSGRSFGDFSLLRRLGQGGMGQVYLAEQLSLKRRVALKLLRKELASSEISRKRFKAEAEAVAQLTHANIVQVHTFGEHDGLQYMVLEFVDGRSLRDFVARKGPPELPLALSIMRQTAAALAKAHEMGVIHRDIKPENVLITRKGIVKVADFGLSRMMAESHQTLNLTQTGTTMGTPLYMSPEQVEGGPLDARTDIYSFGVTCYHMLAGQPPFSGENAYAVAIQQVKTEATPLGALRPDLPPELCAVVARMMAKRPEDRYPTARDILADLKRISALIGSAGTQSLLPGRTGISISEPLAASTLLLNTRQVVHRNWKTVAKAAALMAAVFAVGGLLGWLFSPEPTWTENLVESIDPADSFREQESALRTLVHRTENAKRDSDRQSGVRNRIDLAVLLLRQRETDPGALQRCEKLFQEQTRSSVREYAAIGRVGEAIILAFQDKAAESNKKFQDLRADLMRLNTGANRELLRVVSRALEHNQINAPAGFPKELDRWRHPPDSRRSSVSDFKK